jgi:hypothetical protein
LLYPGAVALRDFLHDFGPTTRIFSDVHPHG